MGARRWVVGLERAWDRAPAAQVRRRTPEDFRIDAYGGHGSAAEGVVVRGRVLDDPVPTEAVEGEGVRAAVERTVRHFVTDELPGVPLRVTVGGRDAWRRSPTPRATSWSGSGREPDR